MYATTKRVSLPINNLFASKQIDQITINTDQNQIEQHTAVKSNYIMPSPHPNLYGMSKTKDPTTITTLCLYKPDNHKKLKLHDDYDLDTYLKTYVLQHPLPRQIPKLKPRQQLPPPRTHPIHIPTPKASDNNSHTNHHQPPTLFPLQEHNKINDDLVEESILDPSIDCITSIYTIDNQHKNQEPIPQLTFATIMTHRETSYHQYSQVPSIDNTNNVHSKKITNTHNH